jgi:hypothetical protein
MTFPLMPLATPASGTAPTITYLGRSATTGDGFPTGNFTLSSGTKLVVVCCEPAGSPAASGVTLGGFAMTQAANTGVVNNRSASVWYLETTLSGSQTVSGSGGSGRSALDVYEIRSYSSVTPYFTGTAVNDASTTSVSIEVPTSTNTIVVGAGTGPFTTVTVPASIGPATTVVTAAYESATSHYSWYQRPTLRGPTTYTAQGSASGGYDIAVAAWR